MDAIQTSQNLNGLLQKYHLRRITANIAKLPEPVR
jgi:hypothetical protein